MGLFTPVSACNYSSGVAVVKTLRSIAALSLFGLLTASNAGCLSLSMLNRESADTKQRIDSIEQRVSALEAARVSAPSQPAMMPGQPATMPGQSQIPKTTFPGYR
jgi:hypothetical protein